MKPGNIRNAYIALGLLLGIVTIGTAGYMLIENMTFTEAFYMTIITIGTVGSVKSRNCRPQACILPPFLLFLVLVYLDMQ